MKTKQAIISEICEILEIGAFTVSNGATEPREFLIIVADQMGLIDPVSRTYSKPELARLIVESFGDPWLPFYSSTGSTVTKAGLEKILEIIRKVRNPM